MRVDCWGELRCIGLFTAYHGHSEMNELLMIEEPMNTFVQQTPNLANRSLITYTIALTSGS